MTTTACTLCTDGFPKKNGIHYGTQRLGMIPNTPCAAVRPEITARRLVSLIKQWDRVLADFGRKAEKVRAYRNLLSSRLVALALCVRCGRPMSAQEYLAGFRVHDRCEYGRRGRR